ncbi:response regulator transcription factor [Actinokineospora sp. NPDC004072]
MVVHPGAPTVPATDRSQGPGRSCRGCRGTRAGGRLPSPIAAALSLAPSLTAREMAAFELLGLGCDNRSIARRLAISERTAKRHVTAILEKLGLESRLQAGLAAMAMSLGAHEERP